MSSSSPDLSATLRGLDHLNLETYINACAVSILVYDYLLTLQYEVKYMWTAKWTLAKVLFFLTRYPVFVDTFCAIYLQLGRNLSGEFCHNLYTSNGWLIVFGIAVAEGIIILRTWAMWGRNKIIGIFLLGLFFASLIAASVALALFQKSTHFIPISSLGPLSTGKGCLADRANIDVVGTYASFTAFDTVIVCLTVFKGLQLTKVSPSNSNLVLILYRDGMLFYITLFVISLISVLVILAVSTDLMLLLLGVQRVVYSVLSARIVFHIHQITERPQYDRTDPVRIHKRSHRMSDDLRGGNLHTNDIEMDVIDVRPI